MVPSVCPLNAAALCHPRPTPVVVCCLGVSFSSSLNVHVKTDDLSTAAAGPFPDSRALWASHHTGRVPHTACPRGGGAGHIWARSHPWGPLQSCLQVLITAVQPALCPAPGIAWEGPVGEGTLLWLLPSPVSLPRGPAGHCAAPWLSAGPGPAGQSLQGATYCPLTPRGQHQLALSLHFPS